MVQKILFIEDDDFNREVITEYLQLQGYDVCALPHGLTIKRDLADFQPDLILLDLKLPEVDGFTLIEKLKKSQWATIPIVILSAYSFPADKKRALRLGARRYLVKPALLREIEQAIEEEITN
ncbi:MULTISPECIES: response regulator [Moorena]|uniref:Two-component response regulator, CheY subfamily n=1 Tax=Moorena producens 3L TaxID=489825 RepID=F4XK98_9CYAN|nr:MULTISPECIES: response regulator [Moorena]EGJ35057.1 two-component response regulator, CheY subfamily [Moorena producens 3L]OLT64725.1 response regulator [Moorena producens 3L]